MIAKLDVQMFGLGKLAGLFNRWMEQRSMQKSVRDEGIVRMVNGRSQALSNLRPAIEAEQKEIIIIGSSLKTILQEGENNWLCTLLQKKMDQGVRVLFILTHPAFAEQRAQFEGRDVEEVREEINQSLRKLDNMFVPSENVKLHLGVPIIFGIKTKQRMVVAPYPYKTQSDPVRYFELKADKRLYNSYASQHFSAKKYCLSKSGANIR